MRLRTALSLSVLSAAFGAGLVACFDLFHSTSGILDACEIDAESCADAGTDLCEWEAGTAYTNAAIACTWLDTCEGTFEANDFGECMVRARLAYDCNVLGNVRANSATTRAWLGLLQAKNCEDVDNAVFPGGVFVCPEAAGSGFGCEGTTRFFCSEAGARPYGESCAFWNQKCNPNAGCYGCLGCAASDAGPCSPNASATCNGDVATSCPEGGLESVDCQELLQQPGTCNAGPLPQSLDPSSACYVSAGGMDAGGCVEGCTNNQLLTACARGMPVNVDCAGMIDAACAPADGGRASCVFQ